MMADILVIDDDLHIRKLYTEFFTREGYNVIAAADGDEAFESLVNRTIDMVILDIELQNANGLSLLKKIKAKYPDIIVVLNSAYSVYKSDFGTWIADAYLMKSADLEPLKDKIKELIDTKCKTIPKTK